MSRRTANIDADQMLEALLTVLDEDAISPAKVSDEELMCELENVIDYLEFPHWTAEQESGAKSLAMKYLQCAERGDLVSDIRSYPLPARSLGQRVLATVFCCLGFVLVIVGRSFLWYTDFCFWLLSFVWKPEPTLEPELALPRVSAYETISTLGETSDELSVDMWPTKRGCNCCTSFDRVDGSENRSPQLIGE